MKRYIDWAFLFTLILNFVACSRTAQSPTAVAAPSPSPVVQCQLQPPVAPDPLPVGFDWRPLAEDWCQQLEDCGYPLSDCEATYLSIVANPPADTTSLPPASGVAPPGEVSEISHLRCEDSEEFFEGRITCGGKGKHEIPPEGRMD